jgi:hypothetical protein
MLTPPIVTTLALRKSAKSLGTPGHPLLTGELPFDASTPVPTIIRRTRRRHAAPLLTGLAMVILAVALVGWAVMIVWKKGGPQPVHSIVIAIPAPQMPAIAGRRA